MNMTDAQAHLDLSCSHHSHNFAYSAIFVIWHMSSVNE